MDESRKVTTEGEIIMKDSQFNALLAASKPDNYKSNTIFTDAVMSSIQTSEILSSQVRKTSVNKKETLFMKLRHLPKFAIVAIAIGVLALLSGTAYATYQLLWNEPKITVSEPTTSVSGRQEVNLSFAECGSDNLVSRYELKKKATITIEDVPNVLKAHCELDTIGTWAQNTYPHDTHMTNFDPTKQSKSVRLNNSFATHIKASSESSITFEGLTKYMEEDKTMTVTPDVKFIADGRYVKSSDISTTDSVMYITSQTSVITPNPGCTKQNCSSSGSLESETLLAVVKLKLPFKYYDQLAWQSLTERQTCAGNPNDTCLTGFSGAIDLYMGSPSTNSSESSYKEIQGVITSISGASVVIKSSSGTLFTINTPTDVIAAYNTNKAARYYNNQKVVVGSSLVVRYIQKQNENSKTISPKELSSVQLQIELVGKSDPVRNY